LTTSQQRNANRIVSITGQLGKVARIHSRQVKEVKWQNEEGGAPGYSAEGVIVMNPRELPLPNTRDDIATWIGVLMHEVGHCDWSPETVVGANHRVYNLAEDARQEALLIDSLPGTRWPLTRAVADLILSQPEAHFNPGSIWPLIAGRRYLPPDLWNSVHDAVIAQMGEDWVNAVEYEILLYMQLIDPGMSQVDDAREILNRLEALLDKLPEPPVTICESGGSGTPRIGAPPTPAPEKPDQGEKGEGQPSGEGKGEGEKGDGEPKAGGGEGDGEPDTGDDESDGQGNGTSTAPTPTKTKKEIKAAAKQASEKAGAAMEETIDTIAEHIARDAYGAIDMDQNRTIPVATEARQAASQLIAHLKPFTDAAEAGLDRFTGRGRIRPDRMAAGYRPDRVFDRWNLDQDDAVSVEIIVAMDVSGSMGNDVEALSQATWVIQKVAQHTAANVTVIAWHHQADVMKVPLWNDRVPVFVPQGSTSGMPMLRLAESIFDASLLRRKWLMVMTDGQIGDMALVMQKCDELRKKHIAITPIGYGRGANAKPFGTNAKSINRLIDMPQILGAMLTELYRDNIILH
jgi:hypothetical protein